MDEINEHKVKLGEFDVVVKDFFGDFKKPITIKLDSSVLSSVYASIELTYEEFKIFREGINSVMTREEEELYLKNNSQYEVSDAR